MKKMGEIFVPDKLLDTFRLIPTSIPDENIRKILDRRNV